MRNGYTKGLVSYGGDRRIFRPQGDPLSSRVSDCLATPLALASSWKSKGAARRIVKDKGSGLIKPIETHRKRTDQCKESEDSDAAKQRSPSLCRDKAEASSLGRSFRARESSQQFPYFSEKTSPHLAYRASTNPAKFAASCGPTVSRWFCPSRPYCGMNSAHVGTPCSFVNMLRRSNGMRCFTS
jgi:hypothetical protein